MLTVSKTRTGTPPLTLQKIKEWLRVDYDEDDQLLGNLQSQAVDLLEAYLNLSLIDATITLTASPRKCLYLPYGDVVSVTSVRNPDGDDVDHEWNGFYISFGSPTYSVTGGSSGLTVSTTVYNTSAAGIQEAIKLALLEVISLLYENRGDEIGEKIDYLLYQNQNLTPFKRKVWI